MNEQRRVVDFKVHIPNLEGDGIQETVSVKVPVDIDSVTGEELITSEGVQLIEDTKARYMGLLLPKEIKAMRQFLGLTQKQMSELLQAGEKSYTRWETGRARPSRMVNVLLRLVYSGKVSVDDLKSVARRTIPFAPSVGSWRSPLAAWITREDWRGEDWSNLIRTFHHHCKHSPNVVEVSNYRVQPLAKNLSDADRAKSNAQHRLKFSAVMEEDEVIPPTA